MEGIYKNNKTIYNHIINSLYSFSQNITIPSIIKTSTLKVFLEQELSNNPRLFYISGFKIIDNTKTTIIIPNYTLTKSNVAELFELCENKATSLTSKINTNDKYLQTLYVHDLIERNIKYSNNNIKESHTIIGPLLNKEGVCEGFAKTFKYFLDIIGVPCLVVNGSAYNTTLKKLESHSWNMVNIEKNWYHVDVTFDTTIRSGKVLRYDYFCVSNENILKEHIYNVSDYPIANDKNLLYYEKHNLVMQTKHALKEFIKKEFNNNSSEMVFKLPDIVSEHNIENKIVSVVEDAFAEIGFNGEYSLNSNIKQHIFCLSICNR